jgi:formylglycine-generating enzyme required for sulfatase activity
MRRRATNMSAGIKRAGAPPQVGPSRRLWWIGAGLLAAAGVGAWAIESRRGAAAGSGASALPASLFGPTVPNTGSPSGPAPAGMVWIPGGEFSMGSDTSSESICCLPGVTRDAVPIHPVFVDGFWMDATEVTNEEFTTLRRLSHDCPKRRRKVPHRARRPRRRLDGLHSHARSRSARRLLSVVAVRGWSELASSRGAGDRPRGTRGLPGGADRLRRCSGLREVGGQALTDGGGVGIRRARWHGREVVCLG